jgi:hypothetical protein
MTLLRRAPREVYRVYGEREFLAGACYDECFDAVPSQAGEGRLQRIAGATMLLVAIGAVGALIAIASLWSATGDGHRVGAGLLAVTGSLLSSRIARAHVWRERADPGASRHRRVRELQADRRSAQELQVDRVRGVRLALARRASAPARASAVASRVAGAPIELAVPASVAPPTVRASAEPAQSGQSEFGFER